MADILKYCLNIYYTVIYKYRNPSSQKNLILYNNVTGPQNISKPGVGKLFLNWSDSKYFSLIGRVVSVATSQLCCCSMKALIDNT